MRKSIFIMVMLFMSSLACLCPQTTNKEWIINLCKKQLFMESVYELPFTTKNLKQALDYAGVKHPDIAYRQAVLETANFTSELFVMANNLMGMRRAKVRETTAIGEYNYHAYYLHWWDSVRDYKLWQDYYAGKSYDLTCYYDFLSEIQYATDILYINKLKNLDII